MFAAFIAGLYSQKHDGCGADGANLASELRYLFGSVLKLIYFPDVAVVVDTVSISDNYKGIKIR